MLAGFQAFYLNQCHIPDRPPTLCDPLERPSGWSREALTETGREEDNCVASMTRPSANLAIGRSTEKRNLRETFSTGKNWNFSKDHYVPVRELFKVFFRYSICFLIMKATVKYYQMESKIN